MKLSTASTRRAVDGVAASTRRERFALVPPLLLGMSVHFAIVESAILLVAGFYLSKL